jgi:hypothetical protein
MQTEKTFDNRQCISARTNIQNFNTFDEESQEELGRSHTARELKKHLNTQLTGLRENKKITKTKIDKPKPVVSVKRFEPTFRPTLKSSSSTKKLKKSSSKSKSCKSSA